MLGFINAEIKLNVEHIESLSQNITMRKNLLTTVFIPLFYINLKLAQSGNYKTFFHINQI